MPSELLDLVVKALKERRCILFVGAGLSSMAGYPSWGDLVTTLMNRAKAEPQARTGGIEPYEQASDFITLAEFARSTLLPSDFHSVLHNELSRAVTPTRAHSLIARTDYRAVITTNYDRILETVFTTVRQWAPNKFTHESISSLARALHTPDFFIFKLHGDIDSSTSIILTTSDYDRLLLQSPHVRSFLHAVLLNYTLLFVGYSLRDPDFQLIVRELTLTFKNELPPHYALMADVTEFTAELLRKRTNIQTISYSSDHDHAEVVQILEEIQRRAPYRRPKAAAPSRAR